MWEQTIIIQLIITVQTTSSVNKPKDTTAQHNCKYAWTSKKVQIKTTVQTYHACMLSTHFLLSQVDYKQFLLPFRDSRGTRTSECVKVGCRLETSRLWGDKRASRSHSRLLHASLSLSKQKDSSYCATQELIALQILRWDGECWRRHSNKLKLNSHAGLLEVCQFILQGVLMKNEFCLRTKLIVTSFIAMFLKMCKIIFVM